MATACEARGPANHVSTLQLNATWPHRRCPTTPTYAGLLGTSGGSGPAGGAAVLPRPFAKQEPPPAIDLPPAKATSGSHVSQRAQLQARQFMPKYGIHEVVFMTLAGVHRSAHGPTVQS
jgi:hypothetical protein